MNGMFGKKDRWKEEKRLGNWIVSIWIPVIYFLILGSSVVVIYLFSHWNYAMSLDCLPNWMLLPLGLLYLYGMHCVIKRCMNAKLASRINMKYAIPIIMVVIMCLQIFAARKYYFRTNWDVRIVVNATMAHVQGMPMEKWSTYFSQCPNNLLIVYVFSHVIQLFSFLPLQDQYFALIIFQCIIYSVTGYLLYRVADKLTHSDGFAVLAVGMYICLVWISPWVTIPYSDSVGLVFPLIALSLYQWNVSSETRGFAIRWLLLGIVTSIGYKIKPQLAIIVIAIVIVSIADQMSMPLHKGRIMKWIKTGLSFFAGVVISLALVGMAIDSVGIPIDQEKEIGITHYVAMGLNTQTKGVYNQDDRNAAVSIETESERIKADIKIIQERIGEMGFSGLVKQAIYKTLTNYNDGTFAWGKEGKFYYEVTEDNSSLGKLLRSIYYNMDYIGEQHSAWKNFAHSIWLAVLILALAAVGKRERMDAVLMLTVVGLTIFEVLFEARARYFLSYVPIYILLAIRGVSVISERLTEVQSTSIGQDKVGLVE